MGYHRAGFEVVGVDIEPQPNFPFEFHQGDAMTFPLDGFNLIHASPPCQRFSIMSNRWGRQEEHPDLIEGVRNRIKHKPYVIENVVGSPLENPGVLCGSMFNLKVRRHRLFESNMTILYPLCDHASQGRVVGVYGNSGGSSKRDGIKFGGVADWREAMGIDWTTRDELRDAIPPAYTEFIGEQLIGAI